MLKIKYLLMIVFYFPLVSCVDRQVAQNPQQFGFDRRVVSPVSPKIPLYATASTTTSKRFNEAFESRSPNILFIIADDLGLDASAQYTLSNDVPNTPTLNKLAEEGLVYDNAWVTPACTTTRASFITGKIGRRSGVKTVPSTLDPEHVVLQEYLKNNVLTGEYASAIFGKWHLGIGSAATHPNTVGVDYYSGNLTNIDDYFDWTLTTNGVQTQQSGYHTTVVSDLAIAWMANQDKPWFTWIAYSAPHPPFHLPPSHLHTRTELTGEARDIAANRRDYYFAALEAVDAEIGRILASMDTDTRDNTLVIFVGDNGTPNGVLDVFGAGDGKGTLYQGGVAVPLIVSGVGVTRKNERESALVQATDIFATIAEVAGARISEIHDSVSFADTFTDQNAGTNEYVFTEFESNQVTGWAVRNEFFKLIEFADGQQELYSLSDDFTETHNLLPSSAPAILEALAKLEAYAHGIFASDSEVIDITNTWLDSRSANCADYVEKYRSSVSDINEGVDYEGDLTITVENDKCIFKTNEIPNHNFNDGRRAFSNAVSEQNDVFEITRLPEVAERSTALSLTVNNAILLNGVTVDVLAAACYGVGSAPLGRERVGCRDGAGEWRYEPLFSGANFNIDSYAAHAQPDGSYHYHGIPSALLADDDQVVSAAVGFAADGFPIYGAYFRDNNHVVRKATSSYRLKPGSRPTDAGSPGEVNSPFHSEPYNGRFREDYEYVEGSGDLDRCNGMMVNGAYGYYMTDDFPYSVACFSGTPDPSFRK